MTGKNERSGGLKNGYRAASRFWPERGGLFSTSSYPMPSELLDIGGDVCGPQPAGYPSVPYRDTLKHD